MTTREYNQHYYIANREKIRTRTKAWFETHRQQHARTGKIWATKNKGKVSASQRAKYLRNRDAILNRTRAYKTIERKKNTDYLRNLKLTSGCADCGYNANVFALEFDHVQPKMYAISDLLGNTKRLMEELTKCEIVCSNCHSIRTQERLLEKRRRANTIG